MFDEFSTGDQGRPDPPQAFRKEPAAVRIVARRSEPPPQDDGDAQFPAIGTALIVDRADHEEAPERPGVHATPTSGELCPDVSLVDEPSRNSRTSPSAVALRGIVSAATRAALSVAMWC